MILRRILPGTAEPFIDSLTADDTECAAELHASCFQIAWSPEDFASLLAQETTFGFMARRTGGRPGELPDGFVLARLAAGEAEILSLAVAPARRRSGLGRMLMESVLRKLHAERAEALFLEVEENNRPALALYRRLGFRQAGQRPGYYNQFGGAGAIIMRLDVGEWRSIR